MLTPSILFRLGQKPSRPFVTAGQPHRQACRVHVHAKTALGPALESRSSQLSEAWVTNGQPDLMWHKRRMLLNGTFVAVEIHVMPLALRYP